ncbi:MAG: hypothetical protein POELPBGB_02787 [Bacteroidia bacterium]|nr:hypothetical protein [Bacteroidia bacterium]
MKKIYAILLPLIVSQQLFSQSQPTQPTSGPGGSDYTHSDVTFYNYAANPDGFYLFEPTSPTPDSANVVVFLHGLALVSPHLYGAWINHLVKHGNIVIYPKYQDANAQVPASEFNANAITGIVNALDTLQLPGHVKPRLQNFAVGGHSYGGLMTANMGILAATSGFPQPKALFSCQGYTDNTTDTRLPNYAVMPADVNLLIVVGDNDAIVGTTFGHFLMDSTINVPTSHKNLITHHSDNHGSPAIGSTHFEPCSRDDNYDTGESNLFTTVCGLGTKTDAVDYFCYWKLFDALMDCAFYGENCNYAFGDTPEQHGMGEWSDGQPLVALTVEPSAETGIENNEDESRFNIYPNPASDEVFINFNLKEKEEILIELFNSQGQLIKSIIRIYAAGIVNERIEIENLVPGIYNFQIQRKESIYYGKIALQ